MKRCLLILLMLSSSFAYAEIDLAPYNLKPSQVEIIRKFEASGKYSDEFLYNFALAAHKQNIAQERRDHMYIPPHTPELLEQTVNWARGGAFSAFAEYAGYRFNGEAYMAECPSIGLFNFGRATGTKYLAQDVLREAMRLSYAFQVYYSRDKDHFAEKFYQQAVELGFDIYLEKI